jgi:ligand-binding sensor domain-containing protein/signal transduction histidine kinase
LRSSSTCRSRPPGGVWQLLSCLFLWLVVSRFAEIAYAIDPNRAMSQYVRSEWSAETGFPGGAVSSIAQTADGFLWIGTEKGLVRFDGVTFRLVQPSPQGAVVNSPVLALIADPDGSLWARLHGPTLVHYPKGAFDFVTPDISLANSLVTAMCLGADGTPLFSSITGGVMAYRHGQFEPLAPQTKVPASFVIAMAQTPNGDLFLGTRDVGLFRLTRDQSNQSKQVLPVTDNLPDRKINCLLPGKGQELWVGSDNGVVRWDGTALTAAGLPASLARIQALAMTRDRDDNVWIAAGAEGLVRLNAHGASIAKPNRSDVTALFEDREGNLWIGTTHGITRLRDAPFTTYSPAEGLPSESGGAIYTDAGQRLWFAPSSGGLYALRDGSIQRVALPELGKDVIYSIGGRNDAMWIGRQQGGLTQLRVSGGAGAGSGANAIVMRTFTQADGLAQNSVYAVHQSRDGVVWAGTLSGGVSRLAEGRFTTFTTATGLASNSVTSILEDANATMWFGTSSGLSSLTKGAWKTYHVADGLPSDMINSLIEDPNQRGLLWIGTSAGIAIFDGTRVSVPPRVPAPLRDEILGLAPDGHGALWIATSSRIVRVQREKLLQGTVTDSDLREFGMADGLLGTEGIKRHLSVSKDARGRIWFSMRHGLSVVDPSRAAAVAPPAKLQVQTIAADGVPVAMPNAMPNADNGQPAPARLRIPPGRQRITFSFVGLSLSVPERVRYRYKLDGFDREWSDPVAVREAVYTNLSPGPYRFRLMASNSDGMWSEMETDIPFDIDPAFWQTRWFQGASMLAILAIAAGLYRFRMQSMTKQLNVRFEERLAERTRIAQELHDTLLQGFVSASMQLHVAADQVPTESPAKPTINRVLDLMGRVIEEGRNAVRGLRTTPAAGDDLEQAFYRAQQELSVMSNSEFRVIVEGRPRPLHPMVRDEVHRLGREALMNAFHHASAKHIEVELEYAAHHLRMLVRDDGVGIDPEVLESGRQGHWGLSGMRERAERMGARLRLWSRAGAGTEVELSVPGHVAFVTPIASPAPSRLPRFTRWRSRD